jgi:hypothetical protein
MVWKLDDQAPGYPPIESFLPATVTTPPFDVGVPMMAADSVWGGAEFIFAKANGTIPLRALCQLLPVWNSTNRNFDWNATVCPNTTLMGRPVGVCMAESGDAVNALVVNQWGWFMLTGLTPVNGTATVAADTAIGITAAGQIGALTASKQIVNARCVTPATQTVVTASVLGLSGANTIQIANTDGWFVGAYASGTGVGASAIVKAIDRTGNILTVSVNNSAAVTGNVTATYNNATIFYNVVQLNRSFAQGAIT